MGTSTDIIYGVGCKIDKTNKICGFIIRHQDALKKLYKESSFTPELINEIIEDAAELNADELYNKYDEYNNSVTSTEGINGIIVDIIKAETNIRLDYQIEQEDSDEYILFSQTQPWYLNESEKRLTTDKLDEILEKYMSELGLVYNFDPDIKLEYYG